jgi:hypothetical protein
MHSSCSSCIGGTETSLRQLPLSMLLHVTVAVIHSDHSSSPHWRSESQTIIKPAAWHHQHEHNSGSDCAASVHDACGSFHESLSLRMKTRNDALLYWRWSPAHYGAPYRSSHWRDDVSTL